MSDTAWQSLFTNMPAILASLAALITATFTGIQAWRNGRKTDQAGAKADLAAAKADVAAANTEIALAKTNEIHEQTKAISDQAKAIAEQTDGQLSKLIEENQRINEAFATVQAILSAREGRVNAVRRDDVVNGGHVDLSDSVQDDPPGMERRQVERRKRHQ